MCLLKGVKQLKMKLNVLSQVHLAVLISCFPKRRRSSVWILAQTSKITSLPSPVKILQSLPVRRNPATRLRGQGKPITNLQKRMKTSICILSQCSVLPLEVSSTTQEIKERARRVDCSTLLRKDATHSSLAYKTSQNWAEMWMGNLKEDSKCKINCVVKQVTLIY